MSDIFDLEYQWTDAIFIDQFGKIHHNQFGGEIYKTLQDIRSGLDLNPDAKIFLSLPCIPKDKQIDPEANEADSEPRYVDIDWFTVVLDDDSASMNKHNAVLFEETFEMQGLGTYGGRLNFEVTFDQLLENICNGFGYPHILTASVFLMKNEVWEYLRDVPGSFLIDSLSVPNF